MHKHAKSDRKMFVSSFLAIIFYCMYRYTCCFYVLQAYLLYYKDGF
jgi:hypothetical protein